MLNLAFVVALGVWASRVTVGSGAQDEEYSTAVLHPNGLTDRLHGSSFLGLPSRILHMSHKKEPTMEPMGRGTMLLRSCRDPCPSVVTPRVWQLFRCLMGNCEATCSVMVFGVLVSWVEAFLGLAKGTWGGGVES